MDTKKLRQKILDLAIHGKLVPQDPNDEPASVLLERIRAEKEKLIKEGKIKAPMKSKSTGDTFHYGKEGPWALPEGWCWTTLKEVCSIRGGKRIPKGKSFAKEKTAHVYIRVTDMKNMTVDMNDLKYIDDDVYGEISRYIIEKDDLYLTIAGTIGKVGEIPEELHGMNLTENAARLTDIACDKLYLMYALQTDVVQSHFSMRFHQVAQPKLSIETASSTLIALPPLFEQKRIVSAIQTLLKCIDSIEVEQHELDTNVENAKERILDLAIHGKLVSQDPSDEPAIELLKRINPDFVPSHNLHYEECLPSGWVYATLGEISDYGHCVSVSTDEIAETEWVLELEDIEKDTGRLLKKVIKSERAISGSRHVFYKGQVLYSKLRTYLNKVFVAEDCGFCTTEIIPITPKDGITAEYLNMYLRSPLFLAYTEQCGYGVKMPRLGTSDARKAIVPVPPTMEQHRIVTVTKQLFAQIDALADNL